MLQMSRKLIECDQRGHQSTTLSDMNSGNISLSPSTSSQYYTPSTPQSPVAATMGSALFISAAANMVMELF